MSFKRILCFGILSIFLCGCQLDSEYDVYVGDVIDVAEKGETLEIRSEIKIQVTNCDENAQKVIDIVAKYFELSSDFRCSRAGFEEYIGFATKAPLVVFGDRLPGRVPTGLAVKAVEGNTYQLMALLDRDRFSALEAEVENMDPTASLKINKVELNINNDLRTTVELEVLGVWINNEPVSFGLLTLERRDEANLIMSNVFSAEVQKKGFARVAEIKVID